VPFLLWIREGQPFYDPDADAALFTGLRENLAPQIKVVEMFSNINDPEFGEAMASTLLQLMETGGNH